MEFKITQLEQAIQQQQTLNYDTSVLEHQLTRLENQFIQFSIDEL